MGVPEFLIRALQDQGAKDLEVISNNAGVDGRGLGILLADGRLRRIIASYVGENKEFARQYLSGELEVELTPQGTLAEKLRSGGAGIPGFYTITGAGTQVAEGGMPWKYDSEGNVVKKSPEKETKVFDTFGEEKEYVLEESLAPRLRPRARRGRRPSRQPRVQFLRPQLQSPGGPVRTRHHRRGREARRTRRDRSG